MTVDRSDRWYTTFAAVPPPIPASGAGAVMGLDRGVAVSAVLSTIGRPGWPARVNREPQLALPPA